MLETQSASDHNNIFNGDIAMTSPDIHQDIQDCQFQKFIQAGLFSCDTDVVLLTKKEKLKDILSLDIEETIAKAIVKAIAEGRINHVKVIF